MRHFVIVVTKEGRLRLKFLKEEHGLLHDAKEQKSYAIIREAYPTNWAGRWSRAYLVHENTAQTVELGNDTTEDAPRPDGTTVAVKEPLNMLARIRMPNQRGELGEVKETWLTPESIFDRTQSIQVRRLANRRFQWFHALLFVSLGVAICLALVAAITLMSAGGNSPDTAPASNIQINPSAPQLAPTSGPVEQPDIIVGSQPRPAVPDEPRP
ncbi:MAG: hypothetical protein WDA16_07785 [Candidatus Thermoplasmatota archaeon]